MNEPLEFFVNEDECSDLDAQAATERLSRALRYRTIDRALTGETDVEEFLAFHAFLAESFPHVFCAGSVETVDRSLLITIPGSDPSLKPLLLMSHMDVVPVVAGTEGSWTHEPFSGTFDGTYVWGRGAIDMKSTLTGNLEAAEYLLSRGAVFQRGLIFALGQDEETVQQGAKSLGILLEERGVGPEFVVDEGNYCIFDTAPFGAEGGHAMYACIAEKGYTDVIINAASAGGHSSNPFGGSSLEVLADAITRIAKADWGAYLTEPVVSMLEGLAPYMHDSPLQELVAGGREAILANEAAIVEFALADRNLFPFVANTCAPTMIEGGSQANNVLPQVMWANINFRMHQGLSCDEVLERCRRIVADLPVELHREATSMEPSAISRADGSGIAAIRRSAARFFRDPATGEAVPVIVSMVTGATDARMYERICDQCIRFSPFTVSEEDSNRGVHGTDERISQRSYLQGIRFVISLIEDVCVRGN
ncbi:MAG: M20/M25/M40 family metallo-hydrolase [Atopobiaceae bacterium]|nr:M20/M25/M40 family metallo-hydrolase [Atopobiaceae bacterium]